MHSGCTGAILVTSNVETAQTDTSETDGQATPTTTEGTRGGAVPLDRAAAGATRCQEQAISLYDWLNQGAKAPSS